METKLLFIKNMVCNRCILAVQNELHKLGLHIKKVTLGKVILTKSITPIELKKLKTQLILLDFEILEDNRSKLIENIKRIIIELVQEKNNDLKTTLSNHLSQSLHYDYNYLSNLFSTSESKTIEQFYIHQKVEKIKELLDYGELSLKEISYQLNYSSVAHLSTQFKKITGVTPSSFKRLEEKTRNSIDNL